MIKTRLFTILLIPLILLLAYLLFAGIKQKIDLAEAIKLSEGRVIEKLKMIRAAQKAYLSKYRDYATTWDSLADFVANDTIFITEKKEIIRPRTQDDPLYHTRTDSIRVETKIIGLIMAREQLFPEERYPNFDPYQLKYIPNTDNLEFELFVDEIFKSGVSIDVIEVIDKYPFDKTRYDTKADGTPNPNPKRMFLRFGSKVEVTTSGNWE